MVERELPEVHVVRVFCDANGGFGNPLGIVRSSSASAGREQDIAHELNYSETAFVDSVEDGVATIRIFTPATELPFAGHPSVGTAWWLASQGEPVTALAEKAGIVTVRYDGDVTWITGRPDWAPVFELMPLPSPADVDALDPDEFATGHTYAYAWIDEAQAKLRSRMFARELGVPEDEATGAAAVRVTAHLGRGLHIAQGRGSELLTALLGDGSVEVGGRVVLDRR